MSVKISLKSEFIEKLKNDGIHNAKQISLDEIHKQGTQDFYNLRKRWSYWIIGWISGLLIFHFLLALAIGFCWVDFSSAPNFLQTILIGDFAEIVGMGFVVVKFFHDEQKEREAKNRYKS